METPYTFRVRPENLSEAGTHFNLVPDAATRRAIAEATGLLDLPRLEGRFVVRRHGGGGLIVTGTVSASVVQPCVVTLEPVAGEVREEVETVFEPTTGRRRRPEEETDVDAQAPEPPEELIDGAADLGALTVEFLVLGLDPYPRKEGVIFQPPADEPPESPFAALAALRTSGDKK
jgi:hypothetical protein